MAKRAKKERAVAYHGSKLYNFQPLADVPILESIDTEVGKGAQVVAGATVTVHYTGALAKNGIIFQSTHDSGKTASFALGEVIEGWVQGIPGMRIGGSRRLIIPAALAYGNESPAKNIPANSDLVFDIDLIAIR